MNAASVFFFLKNFNNYCIIRPTDTDQTLSAVFLNEEPFKTSLDSQKYNSDELYHKHRICGNMRYIVLGLYPNYTAIAGSDRRIVGQWSLPAIAV